MEDDTDNAYFNFLYRRIGGADSCVLQYIDIESISNTLVLSESEELRNNTWYVLRLDYDLLESELRIRCKYDNGTEVFDYYWYHIGTSRLLLFERETLKIQVQGNSYTSGCVLKHYIDYVEAPFKEREWTQTDTPSDSDYLEDRWDFSLTQDNIDETSAWQLVVPYLDGVTGGLTLEFEDPSALANGDVIQVGMIVYGVDVDDGGKHDLGFVALAYGKDLGGTLRVFYYLYIDGSLLVSMKWTSTNFPKCTFAYGLSENRDVFSIRSRLWKDRDSDTYSDYHGTMDVDNQVTVPSQEFVLEAAHMADYTGNTNATTSIDNFDFLRRESVRDVVFSPAEKDKIAGEGGANDPLSILFQTLGQFIVTGLSPFITALDTILTTVIDVSLGLIETAIGVVVTTLTTVIDVSLGLIEDAVGFVETAIDTLTGVIDFIWGVIETIVPDMIDAFLDIVGDFVDAAIEFLGTIITTLLELGWALWYGLFEAVGLEGIFEIGDFLFTGFLQFITGIPIFLADLVSAIEVLFFLASLSGLIIFFGFPLAQGDIGGYFSAMIDYMSVDILFGFKPAGFVPDIPAVAVWLVISIATVFSGTIYVGFF